MNKRDLCRSEDQDWSELMSLMESIPPDKLEEPGYTEEGWSVKDLMAHLASWMAEARVVIEQIRWGTYRPETIPWAVYRSKRLDIDEMNRKFYEAQKDLPLPVVRAELAASRNRLLAEFDELEDPTPEALEWFEESGPRHYGEHLDRLREWAAELGSQP